MLSKSLFFNIIIFTITFSSIYICVNGVDAPLVHIPGSGILTGTYLKMYRTQIIKAYLGIRYAHASRFSPPDIELPPWKGIFNATAFAPNCWQQTRTSTGILEKVIDIISGDIPNRETIRIFDENCLHLNIFVPDGAPEVDGYAVVVWIHSGNFSVGSPRDIVPFQLVFKQKVIVVTFSYRLNIFGFLATEDGEAQGNYGLMDQSAALYWVKKNINYFGGDENRITLMGHNSGAISTGLHMTSGEWSKGVFHRAIIMSGNPLTPIRLPNEYNTDLDKISNLFGCARRPTSLLIQCLKRVDAKVINENLPLVHWGPIVDLGLSNTSYPFIENQPEILFKAGNYYKVPVIAGITDMEDIFTLYNDFISVEFTSEDQKQFFDELAVHDIYKITGNTEWCINYPLISDAIEFMYSDRSNEEKDSISHNLIRAHTEKFYLTPLHIFLEILSVHKDTYSYIFKYRSESLSNNLPAWVGVPKYFDQIFVWGASFMRSNIEWKTTDKKIADITMTLWANFAKSSNPTKSNVYVKWSKISGPKFPILLIDEHFNTDYLESNHKIKFWKNMYPKILHYGTECCNSTNGATSNNLLISIVVVIILIHISILYKMM
ncbi:carboxylesterase 5A [Drosophila busckii]|uniref:carboxylesterase 5A n=1 Tax=Drosophila busckii TaxID=30019 RepID=UPI0014333A51|nr:carboxylesterase 5A [Drosophila busckii]